MLMRKMLRDIRRNKVQFTAIFLMMFFGCFLFSGITGEWNGLEKHFQEYVKNQNMADMWAFGEFSETDITKVREDERIEDAEGRMVFPAVPSDNKEAVVNCYVAEEDDISRLYVKEGIAFDSSKKGVWLDALFAEKNGLKPGENIEFVYKGLSISGEVQGLVYSPEYIYGAAENEMMPDHKNAGFAWVSPETLPDGFPRSYNQIAAKTVKPQKKEVIQNILGDRSLTVVDAAAHPSISMIEDEIDQHRAVGTAFSAAFLLIAVMIVMTTMHRMLKNQKTQIGILKALGFTKAKLILHYLSHNVFICLAGALSGFALGYRLLPGIIYEFLRKMYVLPEWGGFLPSVYYLLPAGCTCICMLISFFICQSYLKPNAADTLYGKEVYESAGRLLKVPEVFGFSGRWNIRDIARNRLRSFMSLCGVLGCTALLFCAFALYDTFVNLSDWTFTKQQEYECKITELPSQEGQKELLSATDGEYLMEGNAFIKKGAEEVTLTVTESTKYLKMAEDLNTFTTAEGGVALSKKTADRLHVREGDTITWRKATEDTYIQSKVKAVIRTPLTQGIVMLKDDYENTGQRYEPTAIIGKEPEHGFGAWEDECSISYQKDLTKSVDAMMDGMVTMIMLLVFGAVLLGSVMLYNLGVLSYLERYREFATMKVLGFADRKIRKIMIQQNVWLSALGILLGIPAGYGLLYGLLATIPDSMDVPVYIKAASWLLSAAGTLALSFAVSRIVSRKIPRINMAEALKARE